MQLSSFTSLLAIAATSLCLLKTASAAASPTNIAERAPAPTAFAEPTVVSIEGSYAELLAHMDKNKLDRRQQQGRLLMCDQATHTGVCVYQTFPLGVDQHPPQKWLTSTSFVQPEPGLECVFSDDWDNCGRYGYSRVWYAYPGGPLRDSINNNLRCFWCRASTGTITQGGPNRK